VIFFPRHRQDIRIQFHDGKVFGLETLSESSPNTTESLTITIREEEQYLRYPCSVFYLGTGQLLIRSTRVSVALLKSIKSFLRGGDPSGSSPTGLVLKLPHRSVKRSPYKFPSLWILSCESYPISPVHTYTTLSPSLFKHFAEDFYKWDICPQP
jgi:hypothetical protein